jgi:hypothetical protein
MLILFTASITFYMMLGVTLTIPLGCYFHPSHIGKNMPNFKLVNASLGGN